MTPIEQAYFAGYADAEVCIALYGPPWSPQVSFHQRRTDVLTLLQQHYGGTVRDEHGMWKYVLPVRDGAVWRFLDDVMPYLREKQSQANDLRTRYNPSNCAACVKLMDDLARAKHTIAPPVGITKRLMIASHDPARVCAVCSAKAFARGLCAVHYHKARIEGQLVTTPRGEAKPFSYGAAISDEQKAHLAGFFDGDGDLGIGKYKIGKEGVGWHIRVNFGQSTPDTVQFAQSVYGGSLIFRTAAACHNSSGKGEYRYQLTARNAVNAYLADIQPYVVEKRGYLNLVRGFNPRMPAAQAKQLQMQLSALKR
jgi:hypothetical protein